MPKLSKQDLADRISTFIRPAFRLTGDGCFLSWQQREAVQGFMIFLIAMAHAYRVMHMPVLKTFERFAYESPLMLIFMCLPLLTIVKPATGARLRDLFVRYFVPYAVFLAVLSLYAWPDRYSDRSASEQLFFWATAMVMNTYKTTGDVAYSSYLWFMPAFLLFQFILSLYYAMRSRIAIVAFLAMLIGMAFIGQGEDSWAADLPFNLAIVLYTLPLSIVIAHALNRLQHIKHRYIAGLVFFAIYVALSVLTRSWDSAFFLFFAQFYTLLQFDEFATHIVRVTCGSVGVLMFAPLLAKVFVFRWIGQNVLIMYLAHLPIMRLVNKVARQYLGLDTSETLTGVILIIITLVLSAIVAKVIASSSWLSAFITPRNLTNYKEAFGIRPKLATAKP
jgi:hypothetical protein